MKKNDKQVANKASTAVGQVVDYGEDIGAGYENQTSDDIAIPFLAVLQGLSPQIETIDGAKPGKLVNTVTEEIMDLCYYVAATTEHVFVEWVPRDSGGGFVAVHALDSDVVKTAKAASEEFGKYKVGDNDLVETFYVYGVLCNEEYEPVDMAVIAFSSTKIKVYKRFNTKIRKFMLPLDDGRKINPPIFAHLHKITTSKEKNNKGEFHNFVFSPAVGDTLKESLIGTDHPAYHAAKECKEMVESGLARAAYDTQSAGSETGEASGDDTPY